jgi:protein O-GlcNAc transferase
VAAPLATAASLPGTRTPHPKLRIGYVSADLREHSVASFFEHVFAAHDRQRFQLHLYSDVVREDATTDRLRSMADVYQRTLGVSDEVLATRVRRDEIDVLVDLAGHMQPNRLPVFARRPAPVQLTYLGYPGTTGMSAFDARISDEWADPCDAPSGSEPVVRVPDGLFAYMPPSDAPEVSPLPAASSANMTFGCFNDTLKLNDRVLESWSEILSHTNQSRLLLKAKLLSSDDVRAYVLDQLAACGVSRDRVELLRATSTRREHLQTYARVDVALDTFPYAGATTSCEALYMGVPVITLAGDRHAGRLGVSILSAAGLADWIAPTRAAYVARAIRAARGRPGLAKLRRSLRARLLGSPLCDPTRVTRALEAAACDLFARRTATAK